MPPRPQGPSARPPPRREPQRPDRPSPTAGRGGLARGRAGEHIQDRPRVPRARELVHETRPCPARVWRMMNIGATATQPPFANEPHTHTRMHSGAITQARTPARNHSKVCANWLATYAIGVASCRLRDLLDAPQVYFVFVFVFVFVSAQNRTTWRSELAGARGRLP